MAIRVSSFTIEVGQPQRLEIAQREDRQFRLAFVEPANAPAAGEPVDFSDAVEPMLYVRSNVDNSLLWIAEGQVLGDPLAGVLAFSLSGGDTIPQVAACAVRVKDASGFKQQVLVSSPFAVLQGLES